MVGRKEAVKAAKGVTKTPEMQEVKFNDVVVPRYLLKDAANHIEGMRRDLEIANARLESFDLVRVLLNADPGRNKEGRWMEQDIASALRLAAEYRSAAENKG